MRVGHGLRAARRARARIGSFRRWRRGRGARDVARARAAGGGGRHQRDAARDDHFGGARGVRRARLFWKYCCDDFGTRGCCPCRKDLQPAPGDRGRHLHPGHDGHRRAAQPCCLARQHRAEIRQHAAMGRRGVVLTPGNYGEQFISGHFHLNGAPVVVISNFVGDAIDCCVREGFTNVLLVGTHRQAGEGRGRHHGHPFAYPRRLPRGDSGRPRGLGRRGREDRARDHVVGHDHGGARGNRGRRRGGRCARLCSLRQSRTGCRAAGACDTPRSCSTPSAASFSARRAPMQLSGNWGRRMSKRRCTGWARGLATPSCSPSAVRSNESCPVIAAPQTADGVMVAPTSRPRCRRLCTSCPGGYDDVRRAIGWPGTEGGHEGAPLACGHEAHPSRGGRLRRLPAP